MYNMVLLSGGFLLLFATAELLYHFGKVKVEYTRKLVHLGTGVITMTFPFLLDSNLQVLALCGSFAIILVISQEKGLLPSINAIGRKSYGSLAYPVAVCFSFFVYSITLARGVSALPPIAFFYLPILVMAFADPVAALIGRKWPIKSFQVGAGRKSVAGCTSFFLTSFLITYWLLAFLMDGDQKLFFRITTALIVAGFSTIAEAITPQGFDNISIPVAVLGCLWTINFYMQCAG